MKLSIRGCPVSEGFVSKMYFVQLQDFKLAGAFAPDHML